MKALVTWSMLIDLENEDEAAELAHNISRAAERQLRHELEASGLHANDPRITEALTSYGCTISFPQPLADQDPRT